MKHTSQGPRRRWTAATATAAVVALAGVGAAQASTAPPGSAPAGDDGAAAPTLEGDAELEGTVTFWHAYSADSPEVETLDNTVVPGFNELFPNVEIETVAVPYDELHQKLVTAVAGDALPDVVRSDIIWVPELADLGVLVALDEEMADFHQYADQTYPGALATNLWRDHYYGLPLDTNTRVQMYNADALSAIGLEGAPTSFDEMRAAAEHLPEDTYLFADNGTSGWNVLPWIWSAGGTVTDDAVTTATGYLNSPESVAGVQLLVDLYQAGAIPDIILGGEGGTPTSDGLATGSYATILDGPWMFPIFAGQYPDFELQTALVPAGDGGSISVVGGESVVLTESSDDKEAALAFMRYLLSEEAQLAMAEVGQMPVLSGLGDQLTDIQPYYATFVEQLQTARPRTPTPAWPQIDDLLQQHTRQALTGDVTVQEALDAAAAEVDALLAEYAD
jgi:multiple sugar transport system substrate-binding protein